MDFNSVDCRIVTFCTHFERHRQSLLYADTFFTHFPLQFKGKIKFMYTKRVLYRKDFINLHLLGEFTQLHWRVLKTKTIKKTRHSSLFCGKRGGLCCCKNTIIYWDCQTFS